MEEIERLRLAKTAMEEERPKKWYDNPLSKVAILLLLGAIAAGLYLWTTRIAVQKEPSVSPESSFQPPSQPLISLLTEAKA